MIDKTEDPAADIAWMRRLAEEGAEAPMQGASILMSAGLIFGAASLFHWAQITGLAPSSGPIQGLGWLAATVLFLLVLAVLIARLKRAGGVRTARNRATDTVWSALGWGIFALFTAMMALGWRVGDEGIEVAFGLIPSVIMVFYGIGWAVSAAMYKSRPLWGLAVGSFAAAPLLAALTGSANQYLAYAAALFLLMALPGFLLMRGARG
ncbi:hypothetical protein BrevBR_08950 [Brevundimonas sp. BR2-1]|uniref:hypothetical protein n=1 Tax=Brevundimonas sp. BR2-1 TaxID=3031123 RepID=UPI00309AEBFB